MARGVRGRRERILLECILVFFYIFSHSDVDLRSIYLFLQLNFQTLLSMILMQKIPFIVAAPMMNYHSTFISSRSTHYRNCVHALVPTV